MAMWRWACSVSVLLLACMACLMAILQPSALSAPLTAVVNEALVSLLVSQPPRLRKLQNQQQPLPAQKMPPAPAPASVTSADVSSAPAAIAQQQAPQASAADNGLIQNIKPAQPPGSVLIMDDLPQQARCTKFVCPPGAVLREMPETIPCNQASQCSTLDTVRCCKGNWPDPVTARMVIQTTPAPITPAPTTTTPHIYLPVFMMHGLGTGVEDFAQLTPLIEREHPGTVVHVIPLFQMKESFKALQTQVETISSYIRAVVAQEPGTYSKGYNMVCFSQGGLLCRAIIEYMDDHNVNTFISLAAPHMGVYGPEFFKKIIKEKFWQKFTLDNVWRVTQSWVLQATLSLANLWHDPFHSTKDNHNFLPRYNNLGNDLAGNVKRKANFVRLHKAVFLAGQMGGTHFDGGIQPSQSGVFDYYKEGSVTEFTPMTEQPVYKEDTFGLKTLNEQGRLEAHNPVGVWHRDWLSNPDVAKQYILPHLQ